MALLQAGAVAPQFNLGSAPKELGSAPKERISLSDFRGKKVVLVFYPADWSPVCTDQLAIYSQALPMFRKYNAEVLGISVDGIWCHQAFKEERKYRLPLLADFEPKGEVSRAYGAYRFDEGVSERALFVIDEEGIIRWSYLSPDEVNPGADVIFDALESLQAKEEPV